MVCVRRVKKIRKYILVGIINGITNRLLYPHPIRIAFAILVPLSAAWQWDTCYWVAQWGWVKK